MIQAFPVYADVISAKVQFYILIEPLLRQKSSNGASVARKKALIYFELSMFYSTFAV